MLDDDWWDHKYVSSYVLWSQLLLESLPDKMLFCKLCTIALVLEGFFGINNASKDVFVTNGIPRRSLRWRPPLLTAISTGTKTRQYQKYVLLRIVMRLLEQQVWLFIGLFSLIPYEIV